MSHVAAPASLSREATDGKTCTTRDLRLISLFALSCTLLARGRLQCEAEGPRDQLLHLQVQVLAHGAHPVL